MADEKSKGGRPLLFQTVEALEQKIEEYFNSCFRPLVEVKTGKIVLDSNNKEIPFQFKPFTISGLAYYLHTNRQTLINYQNRDLFFDAIMRAKERCEAFTEESLFTRDGANGAKFVLLNGYEAWKDRQEIDVNMKKLIMDV